MVTIINKILQTSFKLAKKKIILLFALIIFAMILEFMGMSLIMPVITFFLNPDTSDFNKNIFLNNFFEIEKNNIGTFFLISFLVIILIRFIVTIFVELLIVKYSRQIETDLTFKILKFKLNTPWKELLLFENKKVNKLILSDLGVYVGIGILSVLNLIKGLAIIIILFSFMILNKGPIVLVFIAIFSIFLIFLHNFSKEKLKKISKKYSDILEYRYEFVNQLATGVREMRIFKLVDHYSTKFIKNEFKFTNTEIIRKFSSILPKILVEILVLFTIVGLIIFNQNSFQNILPFLGLVAYILYRAQPIISNIVQLIVTVQLHVEQINDIQKILDDFLTKKQTTQTIKKVEENLNYRNFNTVEFRNVTIAYDINKNVLEKLNYKFEKGKIYGLSGKNGSGKSTFADLITGLLIPDSGEILIDGKKIYNFNEWQNNTAYLSQSFFLFNETIKKNITLDFNNEKIFNQDIYDVALKTTGLNLFLKSLKEGDDTQILDFGKNFSGGQKQKIALARVLYKNPEFIIFDEATSALDRNSTKDICEIQQKIKKDKIIINIAHSEEILKISDRLLAIENKKILEI